MRKRTVFDRMVEEPEFYVQVPLVEAGTGEVAWANQRLDDSFGSWLFKSRDDAIQHNKHAMAGKPGNTKPVALYTAAQAAALLAVDYNDVVSICEAHGICLPVDCIEMVVEIIRLAAAKDKP